MFSRIFFLTFVAAAMSFAASIEATFNFDASKLKQEDKDGAVLFRYDDSDVNFVEHGPGTPVLPCKHVFIAAPKGASYAGCRTSVSRERIPGKHTLYVREKDKIGKGAEIYPPNCVEFVKQYDESGFRIFMFRIYPVVCQPADGTVMRVISCKMKISCDGEARYENVSMDDLIKVRRKVMNPKALDDLIASFKPVLRKDVTVEKSGFAQGKTKVRNVFAENVPKNKWHKEDGNSSNAADANPIEMLKQNNISIDNGSLMFTPISF